MHSAVPFKLSEVHLSRRGLPVKRINSPRPVVFVFREKFLTNNGLAFDSRLCGAAHRSRRFFSAGLERNSPCPRLTRCTQLAHKVGPALEILVLRSGIA